MQEKIEALYRLLGCSNSDIARAADCSPSAISRVRNGSRQYGPTARPILRFAQGVYRYADSTGTLRPLQKLCGARATAPEEIIPALIAWLYGSEDAKLPELLPVMEERMRGARHQKRRFFAERLNETMELLELSNTRLAQQINLDVSSIRRFRNGIRYPRQPVSGLLVTALVERAEKQGKLHDLARLGGRTEGRTDAESFAAWLYGDDILPDVSGLDSLLDSLEQFSFQKPAVLPASADFVTNEILHSGASIYWGTDGLREAVIRFLAAAAGQGGALWLYSDQGMEWMVGDLDYRAKWSALMAACITAGVRIRIIHNIDRGVSEMISAIQSWMPLYMSGMIEPYVCQLGRDFRFSKTIFLRPGKACILGSAMHGCENRGWYEYITDERRLGTVAAEYTELLSHSVPLIRITFDDRADPLLAGQTDREMQSLLSGLSLATMPDATLHALLARSGADAQERQRIRKAHRAQKKMLEDFLQRGKVCEFLALPSDEALFAGRVRANLPYALCGRELTYTPEEYAQHIRAVVQRLERDLNYELVVLPEHPFTMLQIVSTDCMAAVIRAEKPYTAFVFSEPRMVRSFRMYFELMNKQYRTERSAVQKKLLRFL